MADAHGSPERPTSAPGSGGGDSDKKKWTRSHGQRGSGKSQKFNANYLLNFQYEDLQSRVRNAQRSPHSASSVRGVDAQTAKRAYILQNFQFILTESVSYDSTAAGRLLSAIFNFDELPPWDLVHFVVIRDSPDELSCPICLETPHAARVTSCGHTFCYPCLLRHLDNQKQKGQARTCPVCATIVVKPALRSVLWAPCVEHYPGKLVNWTLLSRLRETCQLLAESDVRADSVGSQLGALAQSGLTKTSFAGNGYGGGTPPASGDPFASAEAELLLNFIARFIPRYSTNSATFSRFALESDGLSDVIRARDLADLEERLVLAGESADAAIAAALQTDGAGESASPETLAAQTEFAANAAVERRFCEECRLWITGTHPNLARKAKGSSPLPAGLSPPGTLSPLPPTSSPCSPAIPSGLLVPPQLKSAVAVALRKGVTAEARPVQIYRASDGQQVYLHFLNMRMLRDALESSPPSSATEGLPLSFDAMIEDVETVTQTESTRANFKAISHIPLHSTFKMCFVDLSAIVPARVMQQYQAQIQQRRERIRAVQERDEETAARCLALAWSRYKEGQDSSRLDGAVLGSKTPDISPEMLATMPSLEEMLPALDLGPAMEPELGDARDGEEEQDGAVGGQDDFASWSGSPSGARASYAVGAWGSQPPPATVAPNRRPSRQAEKQRERDRAEAIASLFTGGSSDSEQRELELASVASAARAAGSGAGGAKKGRTAKPKTISLTNGGRQ